MEKILLISMFITGLKTSVSHWRQTLLILKKLLLLRHRGFHPSDYPVMPTSFNGKDWVTDPDIDVLKIQKETHAAYISSVTEHAISTLNYTLFITCITIAPLYIYLKLTFNF